MKLEELVAKCEKVGKSGYVSLIIPAKIKPWQRTKRFFGRKGPLGEIVDEREDGTIMVMFKAKEVLTFLKTQERMKDEL